MTHARTVILGGGFAGLFTALELARAGEVVLASDDDHFLFTPMLYEYLSGEVEAWHIAPGYDELLEENVRFVKSKITRIDLQSQSIFLATGNETLNYDTLVLALGGITN
jgi:NADH dehydrogenase